MRTIAAALSCALFAALVLDALVPAAITAPRIAGAPITTTLAD
jgi:hypothetical protein